MRIHIFVDGQEISEPQEGWNAFANFQNPVVYSSFGVRRIVTHPAVDALRKNVRDLLELLSLSTMSGSSASRDLFMQTRRPRG